LIEPGDYEQAKLKHADRSRRIRRRVLGGSALLLATMFAVPQVQARVIHGDAWGRQRFAAAERAREALNGRPASERTRRDYQRVIDSYRRVYLGAPNSSKADPSVVAAAELLVEMGRRFDDDQILHSAIEQYQFLRREYPGSKYRFDALFTVGEIYKDDLGDPENAKTTFEDFLRRYPRHHLTDDARQALNEIAQEAARKDEAARKQKEQAAHKQKSTNDRIARKEDSGNDEPDKTELKRVKLPRVTGIRHWSTPDYTRVAIDVEQEVQFDSQRIEHPDRIYFDLHDTKLASTLVGKTFEVDDGFLKKIRVAQFQKSRTRVVLEVDDLSNYDAFLLPNPYRLIVDIHGKTGAAAVSSNETHSTPTASGDSKVEVKPESSKLSATMLAADGATIPPARPEVAAEAATAKPSLQATTVGSIPKKIVEADDDGDLERPAKAPAKAIEAKRSNDNPRSAMAALGKAEDGPVAAPTRGKHKSADGNDDEVATLEPAGLPAPPKVSLPPVSNPSPRPKISSKGKRSKGAEPEIAVREAQPTASGDRSLIRALGLKIGRIVIDPGHGGHDTGTIGPNGVLEKDVVLDVGKRLGKLLEARLGADVVYTRQDDSFIPLETRTAIANQEQADLFVSIHANSSDDPSARGVETYYMNFTTNRDALEVAARENAVSDKSIHELQDLVKKIAMKEKIDESREFAGDVQRALHSGLAIKSPAIRDRGVKKAPFIVLIGANMPSILAEISFVSNPTDAHKLDTAEYRQRIAESLYRGVSKYVNGLSGVRVASRMAKSEGQ
jgi:N-acetylmuramoyl-L-alanine amidase